MSNYKYIVHHARNISIFRFLVGMNTLINKEDVIMTIKKIWFDSDYIYGEDENGRTLKQSLYGILD